MERSLERSGGLTLLVTRSEEDSQGWAAALRQAGHQPRVLPCIVVEPLADEALEARLREGVEWADWVAFTSSRSIALCPPLPEACRVAAVGPHTAEVGLRHLGRVDLRAGGGRARSLALELLALPEGLKPRRLLFPCAEGAMSDLTTLLRDGGVRVRAVPVYRTVFPEGAEGDAQALEGVDYILLASPSAVLGLIHRLGHHLETAPMVPVITLGPSTTRAARDAGLQVAGEAQERSLEGMLKAIPEGSATQDINSAQVGPEESS